MFHGNERSNFKKCRVALTFSYWLLNQLLGAATFFYLISHCKIDQQKVILLGIVTLKIPAAVAISLIIMGFLSLISAPGCCEFKAN